MSRGTGRSGGPASSQVAEAAATHAAPGPDAGRRPVSLSSNDYLGLSRHPAVIAAAHQALADHGFGSSGSRAISGSRVVFEDLERRLAAFTGVEAALVFQSGYAANIGIIPVMAGHADLVVHDALNHASCVDGALLSGATVVAYRHRDIEHLDAILARERRVRHRAPARIAVVTDGVFGAEGEIAPLPDICDVADRHGAAVVVDDSHATGVLGRNGRGTVDHFGLHGRVPVQIGSLSKALGAVGGFAGSSRPQRERLATTSRPLLYSTLLPAVVAAAAIAAVDTLEAEPERFARLWSNTTRLRTRLSAAGFDLGASETPIVPVYLESRDTALRFASGLGERGFAVQASTPQHAGAARSRLRFIVRADHSEGDLDACADAIEDVRRSPASRSRVAG